MHSWEPLIPRVNSQCNTMDHQETRNHIRWLINPETRGASFVFDHRNAVIFRRMPGSLTQRQYFYCILVKQMPFEVLLRIAVSSYLFFGKGQFCTISKRHFWKVMFCVIGNMITNGQMELQIAVWGLLYRTAVSSLIVFFARGNWFIVICKNTVQSSELSQALCSFWDLPPVLICCPSGSHMPFLSQS